MTTMNCGGKTMLKAIVLALALILFATPAMSATKTVQLTATWTYPVANEDGITGFEIYNADNVAVISDIAPSVRTVVLTVTTDGRSPQPFYMRAVDKTDPANIEYSGNSNVYVWIPPKRIIAIPGVFGSR